MTIASRIPAVVLGATGYVAGEVLRLLAVHPRLEVCAAVARSRSGEPVERVFGHLAGSYPGLLLSLHEELERHVPAGSGPLAVFSALPHGTSADLLDKLLAAHEGARALALVDLSADYRLGSASLYEQTYGAPHLAPERLPEFTCALPDLARETPRSPIAHPGCFTTAVTLACAAFEARALVEPRYFISAVTGSTGSGREPSVGTHHPERHGGFRAYSAGGHRHEPEMKMLLGRAGGRDVEVVFVPHSGPFARGIHATIHARLTRDIDSESIAAEIEKFYEHTPFVRVGAAPPSLKDVIGSNRCHIGVVARGRDVAIFSVIDNLIKGAAGGAVQWMNRLLGLPEATGLTQPALGWN